MMFPPVPRLLLNYNRVTLVQVDDQAIDAFEHLRTSFPKIPMVQISLAQPECFEELVVGGRTQVLLCGEPDNINVSVPTFLLLERGFEVFVSVPATDIVQNIAFHRLIRSGVVLLNEATCVAELKYSRTSEST